MRRKTGPTAFEEFVKKQNARRPTLNAQVRDSVAPASWDFNVKKFQNLPRTGEGREKSRRWSGMSVMLCSVCCLLFRCSPPAFTCVAQSAELGVSRTCHEMIVDHTGRLHQRVADR
jgi:hypothetical protein